MSKKIGIALSGGGFRAAAFHLGTLNKLKELGILDRAEVISAISGGAIIGGYYGLHFRNYQSFKDTFYAKLLTINLVRQICFNKRFILVNAIILGIIIGSAFLSKSLFVLTFFAVAICGWKWQFSILPISNIIEKLYDQHFFNDTTLTNLPDKPLIAINATNLQTARLFTFSKNKMEDSGYIYKAGKPIRFDNTYFPISKAVMASTCVPHFFSPVKISSKYFVDQSDCIKCDPQLVDGGIYDNQGLHKLTQVGSSYECDIVIVSDAGDKLPYEKKYNNTFLLLLRTVEIFMQRIKFLQMIKNIYQPAKNIKERSTAYFSLGWDLKNCIPGFIDAMHGGLVNNEILDAHAFPKYMMEDIESYRDEITEILKKNTNFEEILTRNPSDIELRQARHLSTSLKRIKKSCLDTIIKHAENITELQVKLYCPNVFSKQA
jgi:NTE family protein